MNYTRLIAGTMTWGNWGKDLNTGQMTSLIEACVNNGITTFDHADIYGGYTTEAAFGKALQAFSGAREEIQLISKCGIQYLADSRKNTLKHYEYGGDYIIWSVNTSLKNLRTDYLDLLLLHRPSPLMQPEEIAKAISILKQEGKIKNFGVSNFTPYQTDLIAKYTDVSVNQISCSLTHYSAMLDGSLDHMMLNGIKPMAWSPLGVVFKERGEQINRINQVLFNLMVKYEATADQLLLAWLLKHPAGIHPVIGTTSTERIINSVNALNITLETEDWFMLLVASQGHKVP